MEIEHVNCEEVPRSAQSLLITYSQEKIAKEGCSQQVVAKNAVKHVGRQDIPSNGIRDGREDPVQLTLHCVAIVY